MPRRGGISYMKKLPRLRGPIRRDLEEDEE